MAVMGTRRGTLVAGIAGVLWPVLALARVPLTGVLDQPSWTDERADIVAFYDGADFDAGFVLGIWLVAVAYVLFLVFAAKLADLLADTDGGSRWVGYLIIGGAAMDTAMVYAYLAPFGAAVFWADHGGLSPDAYLVLHGLSFSFLWLEMVTITAWMGVLGSAIVVTRLFPAWLGWLILGNAALLLVSFFLPYAVWAVAGGLVYLWILVASILMLARVDRYAGSVDAVGRPGGQPVG